MKLIDDFTQHNDVICKIAKKTQNMTNKIYIAGYIVLFY